MAQAASKVASGATVGGAPVGVAANKLRFSVRRAAGVTVGRTSRGGCVGRGVLVTNTVGVQVGGKVKVGRGVLVNVGVSVAVGAGSEVLHAARKTLISTIKLKRSVRLIAF